MTENTAWKCTTMVTMCVCLNLLGRLNIHMCFQGVGPNGVYMMRMRLSDDRAENFILQQVIL